ncbi:TetR/AcrR family transcriptional regulator [Mucilaginibacter myungsuensis]|uniref:TetR/AcrR family transcriptional regulator n=1 Tax=Mucilaginibacter myungsuensis TaxID=649104 RepID=A0A929KXD2_9SPHI|nr:TetR/AcrR family transcriptional regulator [Mucilaginibacter myungsuensis]MBE9660644.1 TetR/AcrR family transcriptional regulator [Mucilaginibacter myungsuensis]MDN3600689.1 TetR/AcrR family transcriptional regulator [Mucilaginibacter myungsuensis]
MDKKLSKAQRTRQFIIETTAPIFNVKGYEGTSMSDITEATGLTKGSIYGNFENKEEVALAAFDHNYGIIKKAITEEIARCRSYQEKLMVYANVYHSFNGHSEFIKGGCPILNTAVEADDTNPPLRGKAASAIQSWRNAIMNLIKAGAASGEFKSDIDLERTALSVIALIEGGVMLSKVTHNHANLDQVLKTVAIIINELKA